MGGLWTDGTSVFVPDGNAIRKVVIASSEVSTIAAAVNRIGASDGQAVQASFNLPNGFSSIWSDGTSLYVTDALNHSIRKLMP